MNIAEGPLGSVITPDWEDTVSSVLNSNRNKLNTILLKLALQTSIYILWKERNSRHGGVCASVVEAMSKAIGKVIKNLSLRLSIKGSQAAGSTWKMVSSPSKLETLILPFFTVNSI